MPRDSNNCGRSAINWITTDSKEKGCSGYAMRNSEQPFLALMISRILIVVLAAFDYFERHCLAAARTGLGRAARRPDRLLRPGAAAAMSAEPAGREFVEQEYGPQHNYSDQQTAPLSRRNNLCQTEHDQCRQDDAPYRIFVPPCHLFHPLCRIVPCDNINLGGFGLLHLTVDFPHPIERGDRYGNLIVGRFFRRQLLQP